MLRNRVRCGPGPTRIIWPDASSDPFDPEEKDPMLTNALDSSLWELVSHRNHYHPSVSTLAKIFQEAFRKPNYALEDFLDHTYGTVRCPDQLIVFSLHSPGLPLVVRKRGKEEDQEGSRRRHGAEKVSIPHGRRKGTDTGGGD